MADNDERKQTASRGNEWEVVQLTASAYAAAPGPQGIELKDDDKGNTFEEDEVETSRALFMSGHFTFPPAQHENLPLETDNIVTQEDFEGAGVDSELIVEEGGRSAGKGKEDWDIKGLSVADEFPGVQIDDEKGRLDSSTTLHGLNLVDSEKELYGATKFSTFPGEAPVGGTTSFEGKTTSPEMTDRSEQGMDDKRNISLPRPDNDENFDKSSPPCEAWWKKQAASLYTQAKEANVIWSIFVAAAVMGLVVFGKRWQRERWHALQLKWQTSANDQKMGKMVGPLSGLKDVIMGGNHRNPFISRGL